jgi:DNA-binding CsgD family transcriptional regulator
MTYEAAAGWLFLQPDRLPERWRDRARPAVYVPLLSQEIAELLAGRLAGPALTGPEEHLAELVARGLGVPAIARELKVSHRTVERRMAALRERVGARSSVELGQALSASGFALAATPTPGVGGSLPEAANAPHTDATEGGSRA